MSSVIFQLSKRKGFSWLFVIVLSGLLGGCNVELFSELDEQNANDILLVLNQNGITVSKSRADQGMWQISVQRDAVQDALATVRLHGLPRAKFVNLGEVFAKEGLIATPAEERQRYAFAVSQELSNTLMQIDGVVVARVHPVIPILDPLSERIPAPSAAVFIKHLHDADLEPMVPAIKRLVAQSIEELDPDNVALTFSAAKPMPMTAKKLTIETARLETSGVLVSSGLALAAFALWPLMRLSARSSGQPQKRAKDTKRQSVLTSISQWQFGLRSPRKKHPGLSEDDGWNG